MNYEENKKDWTAGDVVIHDADFKSERMLMRVTGTKAGLYRSVYLDQTVSKEVYWNERRYLHDPKRFGLDKGQVDDKAP